MNNSLRRLDLNLLFTLDALLIEHSVTRAAERLGLAQPTVSLQLGRLRDFFADPLLLPTPRGMRPTARAEALREPLRAALAHLAAALAPPSPFDPAQSSRTWRIAAFDYGASTVFLPALAGLRRAAPTMRLALVQSPPAQVAGKAARGDIELAFLTADEAPAELRRRVLFDERYVLVGRAGHPQLRPGLSLQTFCELDHAIVSPDGGGFEGPTDQTLARMGMKRNVVLSVAQFLFLGAVLARSDLVAMAPFRLVKDDPALIAVEPPLAVPGFQMVMLWHERVHRDPAHAWLREQILQSL